MKKDIHPEYHDVSVTLTDGSTYRMRSTMAATTMRLDIDHKSHAAWTGVTNQTLRAGRLDDFNRKFAGFGMPTGPKEKAAEGTK